MKLAIFVDQFPVRSQTFVLNQITGLIDLGIEVEVVSLFHGDNWQDLHKDHQAYNLEGKTTYLLGAEGIGFKKLLNRLKLLLKCTLKPSSYTNLFTSLNISKFSQNAKSLLLAAILGRSQAGSLAKKLKFDVIIAHFGFNGITANQLRQIGVLEGNIATIFHGNEISAHKALNQYHENYKALFKQTELMLPISQLWANKLIELGCPSNKIKIHRMGVDLTKFEFKHDDSNKELTPNLISLFTVARFTEKKGIEYALNALAELNKDEKEYKVNFQYRLAGFGESLKNIKQLIDDLNLNECVVLLGPLDSQQVQQELSNADVFLQPSITAKDGDMEGVPVSIMEAMAVGTVVVSTFHSGIPELITHNENGLLAKERDSSGLANNIRLLYQNPELQTKLRENAKSRVAEMGDVDKLNKELFEVLRSL